MPSAQAPLAADAEGWLLTETDLRAQDSMKWGRYPPDVLPCWVADMDFAVAEPIQRAMRMLVDHQAFGYPLKAGGEPERLVAEAFAERMRARYGWAAAAGQALVVTDLVQAVFAAITAFSQPGDGVIVQVPNYPPFRAAVEATRRRFVTLPGEVADGRYRWNFSRLSREEVSASRVMILCNPQNPTGRVLTRTELEAVAEFALRHDILVVSDEIHADLTYPGYTHIPFASLGPEVADRTVTLYSATKAFTIAGLRCAVMHFGSPELMARFKEKLPPRLLGSAGTPGMEATIAAWREGDAWLERTRRHLAHMRHRLAAGLRERVSEAVMHLPEATYLAWIDCRDLRLDQPAFRFFLENGRIAFSAGETFAPGAEGFVRLNFATSPAILDEILARMARALGR